MQGQRGGGVGSISGCNCRAEEARALQTHLPAHRCPRISARTSLPGRRALAGERVGSNEGRRRKVQNRRQRRAGTEDGQSEREFKIIICLFTPRPFLVSDLELLLVDVAYCSSAVDDDVVCEAVVCVACGVDVVYRSREEEGKGESAESALCCRKVFVLRIFGLFS